MKTIGAILFVLGLLIMIGSLLYSLAETERVEHRWRHITMRGAFTARDTARFGPHAGMLSRGILPLWTVVDPEPGIYTGAAVALTGLTVFALRLSSGRGRGPAGR